jgi:PQQ-dependent dehydrogenase (methanol/ethanol family)
MQLSKLKWFVLPATGILLTTWIAVALQNRRIDNNALQNAGKSNTEDWLTYGLNYQEQRYSQLKQIDTTNVGRLGLAFTHEIGPGGGNQEATPLVANGVLYSITNWSITFAVDIRTGKELWRYDPKVDRAMQPRICCGIVNRGLGIYEGKIYVPVIDGRLVALNAATGVEMWSVMTVPEGGDYSMTMAPRIAKGKVIVGNAGSEYPVRGYVTAYDAQTGKQAWRFFTVPGDPKLGFESKAMEDAAKTWGGEWYKYGGGGTVWDGMAYDPDSNLIYFGTGNGGPWPSDFRQSRGLDNLYVCSVVALNVDTGEYKWHYQFVPEDSWDFDSVQQLTLADIRVNGQNRKVIMQANKNGFFYVLDRLTGKIISASPFAQVNWASEIDLKTGRPMTRPEAFYGKDRAVQIFPGPGGAHNWAPMSFNPTLNLMYIPTSANSSSTYRLPDTYTYQAGRTNMGVSFGGGFGGGAGGPGGARGGPGAPGAPGGAAGAPNPAATGGIAEPGAAAGAGFNVPTGPPPGATTAPALPSVGPVDKDGKFYTGSWLIAIDPSTQKEKWRVQGGGSIGGGTLATAGNIVFQTTNQGRLIAYRADTGEKLHEIATNQTGGIGPPITFMVDGKQYIAVAGGQGPRGGFGGPGGAGGAGGPGRGGPGGPGAPGAGPGGGPGAAPAAGGAPPAQGQRAGAPPVPAAPATPPVLPRLYVYVLDGKTVNPTPEPPPAPAGGFGGFGAPPGGGAAPAPATAPAGGRGQ